MSLFWVACLLLFLIIFAGVSRPADDHDIESLADCLLVLFCVLSGFAGLRERCLGCFWVAFLGWYFVLERAPVLHLAVGGQLSGRVGGWGLVVC